MEFTKFEKKRIIRTAQNVLPIVRKRKTLEKKIMDLCEQLKTIEGAISSLDDPTFQLTGYHSEDLVRTVKIPTGKIDDKGREICTTRYEFIHANILPDDDFNNEEITEETDAYWEMKRQAVEEDN